MATSMEFCTESIAVSVVMLFAPRKSTGAFLVGALLLTVLLGSGLTVAAQGVPGSSVQGVSCGPFIRGDVDVNGRVNLTDALGILNALFSSKVELPCRDASDVNDDSTVNMSDAVFLLGFLFQGTVTQIPAPFENCAGDPSVDELDCQLPTACEWDPPEEVCDGIDNDCDGEIDEGVDKDSDPENCGECGLSCAERGWPNVKTYGCLVGICFIVECETDFFDVDGISDNGCEARRTENGTPCDDGNPCTVQDQYFSGVCGGSRRDCSHLDDDCFVGVCDLNDDDGCIAVPREVGTPCDDGNPDTWADSCDGRGNCKGIPIVPPGGGQVIRGDD